MNAHGDAQTPIDANELGASGQCDSSARWGSTVAAHTEWAVCSPWLHVGNLQPYWWGGVTLPHPDPWLGMFDPSGQITPFADAYLRVVTTLTSRGCPPRDAADKAHRQRRR
jgi:hypothetical protein